MYYNRFENTIGNEVEGMTVWKLENKTGDSTGMKTGGRLMEHEENSGNLDDFEEELLLKISWKR